VNNGLSVVVTITDRGPNLRLHRIVDLSEAAAEQLDYVGEGLTPVFLYPVPTFQTESAEFAAQLAEPRIETSSEQYVAKAISPAN
jgi:rare lipoprotein A